MLYKIINPSDDYTIACPDLEIAFVASVLLGGGNYSFSPQDGGEDVPIFMFGGADKWCEAKLDGTVEQVIETVARERRAELADALDSVLIGSFDTRSREIADRARDHDDRRSSTNDIGRQAWAIAAKLRKRPHA